MISSSSPQPVSYRDARYRDLLRRLRAVEAFCGLVALSVVVTTPAAATQQRAAFAALVWPTGAYPTALRPDEVLTGYAYPGWADMPNLARIDRLRYTMHLGLVTYAWHFRPTVSSGRSMVYVDGHQYGILSADWPRQNVAALVAAGYDVVYVPMPLYSVSDPASGAADPPPVLGGVAIDMSRYHDDLQQFRADTFYPLAWYLTPLVGTIGYLGDTTGRPTVSMMGISGGGLLTVMAAALDERVRTSYPVSAGNPPELYEAGKYIDWEYHDPEIYGTVSLQDLYVLGTTGGRRQLKIINEYDGPFAAGKEHLYAPAVIAAAAGLGGEWGYWIDAGQRAHLVSPATMARILADQGSPATLPLP